MYDEYLCQLEEAGKIRNLKDRSVSCYKNYVSYFLSYVKRTHLNLPARMCVTSFCPRKRKVLKPPL